MKLKISLILFFWSCIGKLETSIIEKTVATTSVCNTTECKLAAETILSFMDRTQDPCIDFYKLVCGRFIETTPLPADRTQYGISEILAQNALMEIQGILLTTDASYTPEAKAAQNMYSKCISLENNVDQLKSAVQTIGGWQLTNSTLNAQDVSLENLLADLIRLTGTNVIIGATVGVDLTNSSSYILEADYAPVPVLPKFIKSNTSKNAYIDYIKTCAQGLGADDTSNIDVQINAIIDFNNALAKIIPNDGETVNYTLIYQKLTISELQQKTDPNAVNFDWLNFYTTLTSLELTSNETIGVYHLDYLIEAIQLIKSTNKTTVLNYVMWSFVDHYAWAAGGELLESNLTTWKTLKGLSENVPRNTTCTDLVNSFWGFALAKHYVSKVLPTTKIQEVQQVFQSTIATYDSILSGIKYLTGEARTTLFQKLAQMTLVIGYPPWIMNDTAVHNYFADYPPMTSTNLINKLNANKAQVEQQLKLLHAPVDKTRFETLPSDVDLVYDLSFNSISCPAAALQKPIFSLGQPQALNYATLGSLIEIPLNVAVGFIGGQFDENGNLNQWWSDTVIENVDKGIACLTEQYDTYCTPYKPKLCINGAATAYEHIADYDRILSVYYTYEKWVSENGEEPLLPGLTEYTWEQVLFIKFAQQYCSATVPEKIAEIFDYDEQLYNRYKVNGLLSDYSQFATIFNCSIGPMNRGNNSCVPY